MHWIIAGGFVGAALTAVVGRWSPRVVGWLAALLTLGWLGGLLWVYEPGTVVLQELSWLPDLGLDLGLRVDGLSMLFSVIVIGVGCMVCIYADGYTHGWGRRGAFFGLLLFFQVCMMGLLLSDNLLLLYVFWEGTTIGSFLLIGFESEKPEARRAAVQALLVTGAGGLALLGGILLLGLEAGTFSLTALIDGGAAIGPETRNRVTALVCIGALVKSAQFPFHFWLPRAMVAPTPVSAYLHAATMVKAGIYLLARMNPILGDSDLWTWLLLGSGLCTMLLAAWGCIALRDLKELLAFSTIGALAIAIVLIASGTEEAMKALCLLLLAHAGYKGCMFMVAGAVDHSVHSRDALKLSGLRHIMPATALTAFVGALALAEIGPELSYAAKELALGALHHELDWIGATVMAILATGFVAVAVVLSWSIFMGPAAEAPDAHPPGRKLWVPALVLGLVGIPLAFAPGPISHWLLEPAINAATGAASADGHYALWHGLNWKVWVTLLTLLAGIGVGLAFSRIQPKLAGLNRWVLDGPERLVEGGAAMTFSAGRSLSKLLEHNRLPRYLSVMLLAAAAAVLCWVASWSLSDVPGPVPGIWTDVAICLLAATGAIAALCMRNRFALIASLGLTGYALAVFFARHSAPDVALTQVLVETLMVVLLAGVIRKMPDMRRLSSTRQRMVATVTSGVAALGFFLALAGMVLHRGDSQVKAHYVETLTANPHRSNLVATIISDFRAFDTLGEVTVLGTGAMGVLTLVLLSRHRKDGEQ